MSNDHDTNMATLKIIVAWIGAAFGSISLSSAVLVATLVFTLLQIYMIVRRLRKEIRMEKLEAKLRQTTL